MFGQVVLNWQALDYPRYHKTYRWYVIAGVVMLTIVVYGLLTEAVTMSIAFIVLAGLYFLVHRKHSTLMSHSLTTMGIRVNNVFYAYSDIEAFYIVFDPPHVQTLNIILKKNVNKEKVIQLDNIDPADVREVLLNRGVDEMEGQKESLTSLFSRLLKL